MSTYEDEDMVAVWYEAFIWAHIIKECDQLDVLINLPQKWSHCRDIAVTSGAKFDLTQIPGPLNNRPHCSKQLCPWPFLGSTPTGSHILKIGIKSILPIF